MGGKVTSEWLDRWMVVMMGVFKIVERGRIYVPVYRET